MDPIVRSSTALFVALMLAACQTTAPSRAGATPRAVDPTCLVTQQAEQHIHQRHCTASSGANQLLPQYCTQAGMQAFCELVQDAPLQTRVVQPDHRIRYDSNLGQIVGTANERCGRLVIEPNGDVVTEFPESAGAPTPPPC